MSKNAKIGLAVVLVFAIAGGGIAWWLKVRSAAARELAEAKELAEQAEKADKNEPNPGEHKPRPHEGRELPKILNAAVLPGHPPHDGSERGSWNIPDYRRSPENAGEAQAISPPPGPPTGSMMPQPRERDNIDRRERYGQNQLVPASPIEPPEPPAEAATASAADGNRRDPFGNRTDEDYRSRNKSPVDLLGDQSALEALAERQKQHNGENTAGGYIPHPSGPRASLAGNERRRFKGGDRFDRPNALDASATAGIRGDGTYDVQPNEDFWSISKKLYGTNGYYQALAELNRVKAPDGQLKVNQNILTPDAAELEAKYPALCPKENHREAKQNLNRGGTLVSAHNLRGATRSYTVMEGDTLFDIARYELGKASRWAEIYQLNRDVLGADFDYLVPGTELALPEEAANRPDPVAQRPNKEYHR